MRKLVKAALATCLVIASGLALGLTVSGKKITWTFWNGTATGSYKDNFSSAWGVPNTMTDKSATFNADFFKRLSRYLPDGTPISKNTSISIATEANITLTKDSDVYMTFLSEGAGYHNAVGYFTYTGAAPTSIADISEKIVFPNFSFSESSSVTGLKAGNTVNIGTGLASGTKIGFVLAANGWNSKTGVKTNQNRDWIFWSLRSLNSETDSNLKAHDAVIYDATTAATVFSFEDIHRQDASCDNDFNDAIFAITTSASDAVDTTGMNIIADTTSKPTDTDGDGVADASDEYPADATMAFSTYYPSKSQSGTFALEDKWPEKGDYDMNDLVVYYRYKQILNASKQLVKLEGTYELAANGGDLFIGFGVQLPGISASQINKAQVTIAGNPVTYDEASVDAASGLEMEHTDSATIIIFDDAKDHYTFDSAATCKFMNTQKGCSSVATTTLDLSVTFNSAIASPPTAPYNPFAFRWNARTYEIHLVNKAPTSKINTSLFGTFADASVPSSGVYYKTSAGLPFALDIPTKWKHPLDQTDITKAYPDFAKWVASGGATNADWFSTNVQTSYLY